MTISDSLYNEYPAIIESHNILNLAFENMERKFVSICNSAPKEFAHPLFVALSGGKRLRPYLVFAAADIFSIKDVEYISSIMAIVEILHTASLIHDDIIDDSPIRRKKPTVYKLLGAERAAFCGDYLLSQIIALGENTLNEEAFNYLGNVAIRMCSGEYKQLTLGNSKNLKSLDTYYSHIDKKTANLFSACCVLPVISAEQNKHTTETLENIGLMLGRAFQIYDDIIDILGSNINEKPAYMDIKNCTVTIPLICALKNCPSADISALIKKKYKSSDDIREIVSFIVNNNGIKDSKVLFEIHCQKANIMLNKFDNTTLMKLLIDYFNNKLLGGA